ncbi:hypothetical protein [Brochothrix campestris]|uniref:Uncharacterized protein n=1 Tax=Brochothrix campestris FSL F6-1037 TaxID=1265861 RepID=W7CGD3_9LIST|nr:hypothetical protein [Brochothrix campestris]EUJ36020.1 hypothetical protein BCAMP_10990 [Brochothrix campestris FSL F6-1037]
MLIKKLLLVSLEVIIVCLAALWLRHLVSPVSMSLLIVVTTLIMMALWHLYPRLTTQTKAPLLKGFMILIDCAIVVSIGFLFK